MRKKRYPAAGNVGAFLLPWTLSASFFWPLVFLLAGTVVMAHRSLPAGGTTCFNQFYSPETALTIPNSKVSWAASRIFTCENPVFWLDAMVDAYQTMAFTVTVPVIARFAPVRMSVVVLAEGLPMVTDATNVPEDILAYQASQPGLGIAVFKSPVDQSTCDHLYPVMFNSSSVVNGRCNFYEPFGGSNFWVVLDDELVAPATSMVKIAMYSEDGTTAKAGFAGLDWPEDFVTPFDIPETTCPFCGTRQETNPSYSSLYHEHKDMAQYGGFPPYLVCSAVDNVTTSSLSLVPVETEQCPPVVDASLVIDQPESCKLGCSADIGVCHSHNVFGECTHVVEWDLTPKLGDAKVHELIIFKGDVVQFKYTGSGNAHNLFLMKDGLALDTCNFTDAGELANVVEVQVGHMYRFDEAGMYHFSCGIGCTGFGGGFQGGGNQSSLADDVMMMERDDALCHCNVGQKLTVEVKDASEGLQCHDHAYTGAEASLSVTSTLAAPLQCRNGEVSVIAIDNQAYMAMGPDQCAEFCTPSFALAFISDVRQGSCADEGFVYNPVELTVTQQNSPVPIEVRVTDRTDRSGAAAVTTNSTRTTKNCHCHSYENIVCPEVETAADTLYLEHIEEIETYCQGIMDGSDDVCPYLCFQPMEVLHLHYLECPSRPVDPTYLAVNGTDLCHKAAQAPSGTDCPVVDLVRSGTTPGGAVPVDLPVSGGRCSWSQGSMLFVVLIGLFVLLH